MNSHETSLIAAPRHRRFKVRHKKSLVFYILMMILPVTQILLFYVYVNFNSFLLAFRELDYNTNSYKFVGLSNFKMAFENTALIKTAFKNSILLTFLMTIFGSFGAILFSYYIYKKFPGSAFFKVILYTPHIISAVVFVIMYKYFVELVVPELWLKLTGKVTEGLVANPDTTKATIIVFNIWISFGSGVLLYSGAMSSISESIIESGKLDGITPMKELIFIVIPSIWSTFVTFMVMRVVSIFTDQMSLFHFYGANAEFQLQTFGYYLYSQTQRGVIKEYPRLAAMGFTFTLIAVPLTLGVRTLMEKFGPRAE